MDLEGLPRKDTLSISSTAASTVTSPAPAPLLFAAPHGGQARSAADISKDSESTLVSIFDFGLLKQRLIEWIVVMYISDRFFAS